MRAQSMRWKIARRHVTPRRRVHWLRWIILFLLVGLLLTSGATAAAGAYFVSQLPSTSTFHVRYAFQDARIYDSTGQLLYNMADLRKNAGRRIVEPLQGRYDYGSACQGGVNRIPRILQNATIATEDATFYKNPGFDPLSIARAAYQDATQGHIVSGASTITQQVVRAVMLSDTRTFTRKAQEIALSYEISQHYSKRKILSFYLNSVNYGNLAYGAPAAARVYFHEPVCRLDQAQAALLAGLPRAPTAYNPVIYRAAAYARMREVASLMLRHGYLHSRAEEKAMLREARHWHFSAVPPRMRYPQFTRYVIGQLRGMPNLRDKLYQGIDVYTTINPRLQDVAQRLVSKQIDSLTAEHVTDGALVSLDLRAPHYGWVLAMVGSAHYRGRGGQINMALTPRQPGSSMKPFNYIYAFAHGGIGPGTDIIDAPLKLPDPNDLADGGWYQPTDYDHLWHGVVSARVALANSLNVPAVKVEYYLTSPHNVAWTAYRFGMTSLYRDNPGLACRVCYAVTLGGLTRGTRLIQETSAYGVFATGGVTVPSVTIWKVIKRSNRKVLYCSADCPKGIHPSIRTQPRRVVDPAHAYEMTSVLSDNSARCGIQVCEFGLTSPLVLNRPAAAKTGTTNSWTDNWTVGYTPQLVTGVWTGNADRSPMINIIGVTGAAPVWHDYMEQASFILRLPAEGFKQPPGVITVDRCSVPNSMFWQIRTADLYVPTGQKSPYPLCALPDRGYEPAACPVQTRTQPSYVYGLGSTCGPAPGYSYGVTNPQPQPYGSGYQPTYQYPPAPAPAATSPPAAAPKPRPAPRPASAPTSPPPVSVPTPVSNLSPVQPAPATAPPVINPPAPVQPVPTAPGVAPPGSGTLP